MSESEQKPPSQRKFSDEELLTAVQRADPPLTGPIRTELESMINERLHRNTVPYRLKRHPEITGEPFANTTKWFINKT